MQLTYPHVQKLYADHKYPFFDQGKFNVNIFGIRAGVKVDMFDDFIGVAYRDESQAPQLKVYSATTDPGLHWLKSTEGNPKGTFILAPGYYPKCWVLGKHKGQYEALVQNGSPFLGWRDNDKDEELDMNGPATHKDVKGLNLHTTSHLRGSAAKVGAYSAGCQVMRFTKDHLEFMEIVKKSMALYGKTVSYALFKT